MKKHVTALCCFWLISPGTWAQSSEVSKPAAGEASPKQGQAFYMGLFGDGITISANYDSRFAKSRKGLGMHIGLRYFGSGSGSHSSGIVSIPAGITSLQAKRPNIPMTGEGGGWRSRAGLGFGFTL